MMIQCITRNDEIWIIVRSQGQTRDIALPINIVAARSGSWKELKKAEKAQKKWRVAIAQWQGNSLISIIATVYDDCLALFYSWPAKLRCVSLIRDGRLGVENNDHLSAENGDSQLLWTETTKRTYIHMLLFPRVANQMWVGPPNSLTPGKKKSFVQNVP